MKQHRIVKKDAPRFSEAHLYDVIRTPVVSEKSVGQTALNQYTFKVMKEANKREIAAAVEAIFKVKVESVNTINQIGKAKVFRGRRGRQQDYKKAIVRLAEGNTIDVQVGV